KASHSSFLSGFQAVSPRPNLRPPPSFVICLPGRSLVRRRVFRHFLPLSFDCPPLSVTQSFLHQRALPALFIEHWALSVGRWAFASVLTSGPSFDYDYEHEHDQELFI